MAFKPSSGIGRGLAMLRPADFMWPGGRHRRGLVMTFELSPLMADGFLMTSIALSMVVW